MPLVIVYFIISFIVGWISYDISFDIFYENKPSIYPFLIGCLCGILWPIALCILLGLNVYIQLNETDSNNITIDNKDD